MPGITYVSEEPDTAKYGLDQLKLYHAMGSDVVYLRKGTSVVKAIVNIHFCENGMQHYLTELWLQKLLNTWASKKDAS